jgi:hypothetical protein
VANPKPLVKCEAHPVRRSTTPASELAEEHSALAAEVLRALGNSMGDRPYRVHTSDLRIYVEAVGLSTFADGAVVSGRLQQHGPSPDATALNPSVLLEVTSDSSEEYDTGAGRDHRRPGLRRERCCHARRRRDLSPELDRLTRRSARAAMTSLGTLVPHPYPFAKN